MGGGRKGRVRTARDCSCLSAIPIFGCSHVVGRELTKVQHCQGLTALAR